MQEEYIALLLLLLCWVLLGILVSHRALPPCVVAMISVVLCSGQKSLPATEMPFFAFHL